MDEAEARARCAELSENSPERTTHSWIPREQADGSWKVVKLAVPSPSSPETVKTVSAKDQIAQDDPRPAIEQNLPPHSFWV